MQKIITITHRFIVGDNNNPTFTNISFDRSGECIATTQKLICYNIYHNIYGTEMFYLVLNKHIAIKTEKLATNTAQHASKTAKHAIQTANHATNTKTYMLQNIFILCIIHLPGIGIPLLILMVRISLSLLNTKYVVEISCLSTISFVWFGFHVCIPH